MESRKRTSRKEAAEIRKDNRLINVLYVVLFLSIVGYIATHAPFIGMLAFLMFIVLVVAEIRTSFKSEGAGKTARDVAIAIGAAVLVFWLIPALVLGTASPINAVVSCSMLPTLHRGDMVLLHGIPNMGLFLQRNRIPVVNVSQSEFSSMVGNMRSEFVEPMAYFNGNRSNVSTTINGNASFEIGTYNLMCLLTQSSPSGYSGCYVPDSSASSNLIRFGNATATLRTPTGNATTVYVPSITIGNTTIVENYSSPIIVYKTTRQDSFSGDIIHRVFAAMRVGSSYYLLTKGDNNPVLDIEALNYPVNQSNVVGYVVAHVPYLGYASLIIKGQVGNVPGCNQTIVRS